MNTPHPSPWTHISLNNAAVGELRLGNTREAMSLLTSALKECRSVMGGSTLESFEYCNYFQLDDCMQEEDDGILTSGDADVLSVFPRQEEGRVWTRSYYLYNTPILLPPSTAPTGGAEFEASFSSVSVTMIAAIITFNLGICSHKISQAEAGIESATPKITRSPTSSVRQTTERKYLAQSVALFEKAYMLVCYHQKEEAPSSSPSMPLFSLAILNNIGVILRRLGREETSQQFFDRLIVYWVYLCTSDRGELLRQKRPLSKSCRLWDGILFNALQQGQSCAARAA